MSIFIIAEVGINHNGDMTIAKKLIDVAKEAGADAVKFQKRTIDLVYTKEELDAKRESPWGTTNREQKMGLEFGKKEYDEIDRYCKEKGIEWFASPWDIESHRFLLGYNMKHNKVASALLTDMELLTAIAKEKKHTFISTGMSTMEEIEAAVDVFKKHGCSYELMHCNSTYPMTNDDEANLRVIETLKKHFGCNVGYSGHEVGLAVSYGAAALGISSLERHITINRAMYGSDQPASVEPAGFRMLVGVVRQIERAMGDGVKKVYPSEVPIRKKLRKK
ncbi:MAG: N-acetylneuraminate synthase family protein [Candidatus Margulisbacteria bacterium]|jgi:N-acetylneuraminate synthase|nr:N-acetylneuraminate synthase family protein [Candidatus Margulisiibacteriota bacterium]